jgi:quercetin dioxygenase-like cupin family protein
LHSETPGAWRTYDQNNLAFNVVYTTSEFPASLDQDADIKAHEKVMSGGQLGLVNPNGTVCRIVDFAPGCPELMHRTQSLDYGIVLEGKIEMVLDDGVTRVLERGDVAVQRATMHGWRNPSQTDWARLVFVLQDCQKLTVDGKNMGENLGRGRQDIEESGN